MNMHSSAAFNYELQRNEKDTPIKEIKKRKRVKTVSVLRAVACTIFVVALLSVLLYSRVQQAELTKEYSAATASLTELKNQNSRMEIEIESKLSLSSIEQQAEELGLCPIGDTQAEYINFNDKDKAEVVKKQTLFSKISDWFKGLFE